LNVDFSHCGPYLYVYGEGINNARMAHIKEAEQLVSVSLIVFMCQWNQWTSLNIIMCMFALLTEQWALIASIKWAIESKYRIWESCLVKYGVNRMEVPAVGFGKSVFVVCMMRCSYVYVINLQWSAMESSNVCKNDMFLCINL